MTKLTPEARAVLDAIDNVPSNAPRRLYVAEALRAAVTQMAKAEGITISQVDPYDILSIAYELEGDSDDY